MHLSPHLRAACLALGLLAALPAGAAKAQDSAAPKKKVAAPKFIPNSTQESARERERRLLRECKGRPNAGACSGYAS
ncbi:hypothetical protein [Pseudorhodoferax sp.]|uniref:hypothetical protein n=1 Tax=Pseudorhodoferax sp. TaxID=1993553 RepID=UPI002DD6A3BD|nr:hypothetical protein [Pseudorhodoferax sp.]